MLDTIVSKCQLQVVEIPTLEDLLNTPKNGRPWKRDYNKNFADTFVVLHTSGSTGLPKAINVTHGLYGTLDSQQRLESNRPINVNTWINKEVFVTLPPFHAAGMNFFGWSVFQGTVVILGPPDTPPSVSTIEHALDLDLAFAGVTAPSILE